jgi:hypothetical protein
MDITRMNYDNIYKLIINVVDNEERKIIRKLHPNEKVKMVLELRKLAYDEKMEDLNYLLVSVYHEILKYFESDYKILLKLMLVSKDFHNEIKSGPYWKHIIESKRRQGKYFIISQGIFIDAFMDTNFSTFQVFRFLEIIYKLDYIIRPTKTNKIIVSPDMITLPINKHSITYKTNDDIIIRENSNNWKRKIKILDGQNIDKIKQHIKDLKTVKRENTQIRQQIIREIKHFDSYDCYVCNKTYTKIPFRKFPIEVMKNTIFAICLNCKTNLIKGTKLKYIKNLNSLIINASIHYENKQ